VIICAFAQLSKRDKIIRGQNGHSRYRWRKDKMRDKKLAALIILVGILYAGHAADHIARGDVSWQIGGELFAFAFVTVAIYAVIVLGLYFYRQAKIGPRFWTIFAAVAAGFGWYAHFSPFTDQTPTYIFKAYKSPMLGSLAVLDLVALALVLIAIAFYAGSLWLGRRSRTG
jgi:hypothetical protein